MKSGDALAGVAAATEEERIAAKFALADLPLTIFLNEALIPYEDDTVTRLIMDNHDKAAFAPISKGSAYYDCDTEGQNRVPCSCTENKNSCERCPCSGFPF